MMIRLSIALLALLASAAPLAARQEDPAETKKKILDKVRTRLAEEHKKIMERISKIIDEELAVQPVAKVTPDKRIREIEKEIEKLEDKQDDLRRDLRAEKRKTEDAKIIEDGKKNPPQTGQDLKDEFDAAMKQHEAKEFDKSIPGFKRIYYILMENPKNELLQGFGMPSAYNVACGYALAGKKDEAIDFLEISIKLGYTKYEHMRKDSDLDNLRKERRYLRLMEDN